MFNKLYNALIPDSIKKDIVIYSNAKNIINATIIAIFADPFYAIIYYNLNYPLASYALILLGFVFLMSVLILKYAESLFIARELFIGSLFICLAWLSYTVGGITSSVTFWLLLPPFLMIKFGGIKSGFFWAAVSFVFVILLFILKNFSIPIPPSPISNELFLRTFSISGLIIIMVALAYFFELGKRKDTYELDAAKARSDFLFDKAQEASQLKSEFLSNMSHELRTPLNSICGFAQIMSADQLNALEYMEFSKNILTSANELLTMIEAMLDLSKMELGKIDLMLSEVDLENMINDIIKTMFHEKMIEKKLQLTINIDDKVKNTLSDAAKLRQIIYNYLSNAVKFTPEGGKIEIRAFSVNHMLRIEVKDTGIGIEEKDLVNLFTTFHQLDSGITKKYQGAGIGLALVRHIAECQGGKVGVESTIGKGSMFYVMIPYYTL